MNAFLGILETQRWDDHRYYHQSRINQTLHLISAISFLVAYVMLFVDPAVAGLIGWLVSMTTRQAGHFFFEPHGYDDVNRATFEHKEAIKVGYNLQRKVVLLGIWALLPVGVWLRPAWFGLAPAADLPSFLDAVGWVWLWLGVAGVLFRMLQLFVLKGVGEGIAWVTKILTDPFHDIAMYHDAPLWLLRGQLIDPMQHVRDRAGTFDAADARVPGEGDAEQRHA